jgi:hypothetical protein
MRWPISSPSFGVTSGEEIGCHWGEVIGNEFEWGSPLPRCRLKNLACCL